MRNPAYSGRGAKQSQSETAGVPKSQRTSNRFSELQTQPVAQAVAQRVTPQHVSAGYVDRDPNSRPDLLDLDQIRESDTTKCELPSNLNFKGF